jgi:hypothetical protein
MQILLQAFRKAAQAGARCPGNDELSDLVYAARGRRWRDSLDQLIADGKVRIEIAGKNWRTVYLVGENLNTAPEPSGAPVWLVLDKGGRRRP